MKEKLKPVIITDEGTEKELKRICTLLENSYEDWTLEPPQFKKDYDRYIATYKTFSLRLSVGGSRVRFYSNARRIREDGHIFFDRQESFALVKNAASIQRMINKVKDFVKDNEEHHDENEKVRLEGKKILDKAAKNAGMSVKESGWGWLVSTKDDSVSVTLAYLKGDFVVDSGSLNHCYNRRGQRKVIGKHLGIFLNKLSALSNSLKEMK